jgi:hypothetical protein
MAATDPRIDAHIAKSQPLDQTTRERRVRAALEWLAEGRTREWKDARYS